jgi:hypothetical protein
VLASAGSASPAGAEADEPSVDESPDDEPDEPESEPALLLLPLESLESPADWSEEPLSAVDPPPSVPLPSLPDGPDPLLG